VLLSQDFEQAGVATAAPDGGLEGAALDYAQGEDSALRAAHAALQAGRRCALVTIVGVEGAAPRPVGAQMAVVEDGSWTGYISGGCLESAVAQEALQAMAAGESRLVRYGRGSKYIDIVLPCGSGLDLHIDIAPDATAIGEAVAALDAREPATLTLHPPGAAPFERAYVPTLRIMAAGRGPAIAALLDLAASMGFATAALSPEQDVVACAAGRWDEAQGLIRPEDRIEIDGDPYSAFVLMFHDHHWEIALCASAVKTECFYIGAMGSRTTSANRQALLREAGLNLEERARVRGPIGLFPHAKRPGDLALSVLAEIVGEFRARYGA
jgi:xanthine dehydrogenase accessory factor